MKQMLFSIFIVFFKLYSHKIVVAKPAQCIKVPYVKEKVNIYKTDLSHYNSIYNTIYYLKKGGQCQ